ncbi:MAG: hypothetical protein HN826_14220 [Methylococcales bacterium]|jgi:hypothetical protein|nr:hypothetical protein [Methylococcales bacterium]
MPEVKTTVNHSVRFGFAPKLTLFTSIIVMISIILMTVFTYLQAEHQLIQGLSVQLSSIADQPRHSLMPKVMIIFFMMPKQGWMVKKTLMPSKNS